MRLEDPLVVFARIRTALVGVMQETSSGLTAFQRHLEGLDHEVAIIDRTDRPANQEARVEVEDRREIELSTAADHELGGIADPALVRRFGHEVLAEHIRRDGLGCDRSWSCA